MIKRFAAPSFLQTAKVNIADHKCHDLVHPPVGNVNRSDVGSAQRDTELASCSSKVAVLVDLDLFAAISEHQDEGKRVQPTVIPADL
jgi:hypothetical protein